MQNVFAPSSRQKILIIKKCLTRPLWSTYNESWKEKVNFIAIYYHKFFFITVAKAYPRVLVTCTRAWLHILQSHCLCMDMRGFGLPFYAISDNILSAVPPFCAQVFARRVLQMADQRKQYFLADPVNSDIVQLFVSTRCFPYINESETFTEPTNQIIGQSR